MNPSNPARPGMYWYFMDENQEIQEKISDLESVKEVGISNSNFFELGIGVPWPPVDLMSEEGLEL